MQLTKSNLDEVRKRHKANISIAKSLMGTLSDAREKIDDFSKSDTYMHYFRDEINDSINDITEIVLLLGRIRGHILAESQLAGFNLEKDILNNE